MMQREKKENNEEREGTGRRQEESPAEGATQQNEELQKKLEELQKASDVYRDQLLRKAAEFENFKKRTESDFVNLIRNANEDLVLAILPILDDFNRSLKAGKDQKDYDAFYRGIELIQSKLLKILEAQGLQPFESIGKPFDVKYHDALLQIPRGDVPPHTVIEEVEQGYKFNDKILRHAKVVVSAPAEIPPAESEDVEPPKVLKD